jgi:hypothetical protein
LFDSQRFTRKQAVHGTLLDLEELCDAVPDCGRICVRQQLTEKIDIERIHAALFFSAILFFVLSRG